MKLTLPYCRSILKVFPLLCNVRTRFYLGPKDQRLEFLLEGGPNHSTPFHKVDGSWEVVIPSTTEPFSSTHQVQTVAS